MPFKENWTVLHGVKASMNQMNGVEETSIRHRIIFQLYIHRDQQIYIINLSSYVPFSLPISGYLHLLF